jgi:hypothetical protein
MRARERVEQRDEDAADALALPELLGEALQLGVHPDEQRVHLALVEQVVAGRQPGRDARGARATGGP